MAQPNIPLMVKSATALAEQLELCGNVQAVIGGTAILARLDQLSTNIADMKVAVARNKYGRHRIEASVRDSNAFARLRNNRITRPDQALIPLLNRRTGTAVSGFPAMPAASSRMSDRGADLVLILGALGEPANGDAEVMKKRLRLFVGLVDIS